MARGVDSINNNISRASERGIDAGSVHDGVADNADLDQVFLVLKFVQLLARSVRAKLNHATFLDFPKSFWNDPRKTTVLRIILLLLL